MDTLKFMPGPEFGRQEAVRETRKRFFETLGRLMVEGSLVWRDITVGRGLDARPHNFYKAFEYEFIFPQQSVGRGIVIRNHLLVPESNQPENNQLHHVMHWEYDPTEVQGTLLVEYDDSLCEADPYLIIRDLSKPAGLKLPQHLEVSIVDMLDPIRTRTLANDS